MKILGIETSCDETAAAVVEDGVNLLSNVVASSQDIHIEYGGVVPEIAAREHIQAIIPVVEQALEQAKCSWEDIDGISFVYGPGLSGSLLIGSLTAKTLAWVYDKPLYPVDHVLGHVYANFLIEPKPEFPLLALIVSGGHSQLVLFENHFKYQLLGQTLDDAVGEAFDKAAKIIGLPYPGGPAIEKIALEGEAKYDLPIAKLSNPYDFSFSGLTTAFLRLVQSICGKDYTFPSFKLAELLDEQQVKDLAASFQNTAIKTLVKGAKKAYKEFSPKIVVIAGGVAASKALRAELQKAIPLDLEYAPINLCTDNAAMIASLGYFASEHTEPTSPHNIQIEPSLSMKSLD